MKNIKMGKLSDFILFVCCGIFPAVYSITRVTSIMTTSEYNTIKIALLTLFISGVTCGVLLMNIVSRER